MPILAEAWTSGEVLAVISAVGALVTLVGGTVTGVIVAWKANAKAGEALVKAGEAKGNADGAQLSVGRMSNRVNGQDQKISTLELASPAPQAATLQVVQQPPAPKPRRVRIGNEVFEGILTKVCEEDEVRGK